MKFKLIISAIVLFMGAQLTAQMNSTVVDPNTKTKTLMGYCNKKGLQKGEYGAYFNSQYDLYKPAEAVIAKLENKINDYEITVVLGTWCSDSKREVPRFFKVLNEAGYNDKRVKIIGVDKNKDAILVDIKDLNIERVPTFIIYKNDKEVGRIIETPRRTLESDLLKIVK